MSKRLLTLLPIAFISLLLQSCSEENFSKYNKAVIPDLPETMHYPQFTGLEKYLDETNFNFHSIIIYRDSVIFERYFDPFTANDIHDLNSCTKSITATMIGLAIRDEIFKDDSVNLKNVFPDYNQDLLLCHLLSMTSGYDFSEFHKAQPEGDILQLLLSQPRPDVPGKDFYYDEGNYHLLSEAFQLRSGRMLADYAREDLFSSLGIKDFQWESDPEGVTRGDGLLKTTPGNMLKLGLLFLHGGKWGGKEIVPQSWIAKSVQPYTLPTEDPIRWGYGYGWWLPDFGGFAAVGTGGQMIYVNPDSDLVVITTAGLKESYEMKALTTLLVHFILKIDSSAPFRPDTTFGSAARSEFFLPHTAFQISGKEYSFSNNELGLKGITFYFQPDSMVYMKINPGARLGFKLGDRFNIMDNEEGGLALRAKWADDQNFIVESQDMNYFDRDLYHFCFKENEVILEHSSYCRGETTTLIGR